MTITQIRSAHPPVPTMKGAGKLTWAAFVQVIANPFVIGFGIGLPVVMYLMFGAGQAWGQNQLPNGNVAAQILVTMALYGALLGVASLGSGVALERAHGLSRLFALTPVSPLILLATRAVAAVGIGLVMISVTYVVGAFTGAEMAGPVWVFSAAISMAVTVLAAAIGLACGLAIRSDASYAATSSILVLGGFSSGMFMPVDQMGVFFEKLAPWTPLWGANQLSLLPLMGADHFQPGMIVNIVVWTVLFTLAAVWGWKRDTDR